MNDSITPLTAADGQVTLSQEDYKQLMAGYSDTRHNVNESADKITLNTKIKRGTGTRDQDEIKVKVKGDDPQEAAEKLHETVVAVGTMNTVNALRGTQPSSAGDDE